MQPKPYIGEAVDHYRAAPSARSRSRARPRSRADLLPDPARGRDRRVSVCRCRNPRSDRTARRADQHRLRQLLCSRRTWPIPAHRNSPTTRLPMTLAEQRATAAGIEYRFFYYPPVFLLLCAALARLPYLVAFLVFETATLALCLIVMRADFGRSRLVGDHPGIGVPGGLLDARLGAECVFDGGVVRRRHIVDRPPADRLPGFVSGRFATSRISRSSSRWRCSPDVIGALSGRLSARRQRSAGCR